MMIFVCFGVMYSGEYDVCNVSLSVYPHRAGKLKRLPDYGGNRIRVLWDTSPIKPTGGFDLVPQLAVSESIA